MLLNDAYRFTLQFADVIIASARHLYVSALPLMPSCLLYETYQTRIPDKAVKVHHCRDSTWRPCLRTLSGHSGEAVAIAPSKDSTYIASGSKDATLRVWDSTTGTHLAQCQLKPRSSPYSVAFSADGTYIIASAYKQIYVWNWLTGDTVHWEAKSSSSRFPRQRGEDAVAVSNTFNTRLADHHNGVIRVWDLTGLQLNVLKGHSASVCCIAFSPDDSRIVSASGDDTIRLWDLSSGKQLMKFGLFQDIVSFSPDGRQIFSASENRICVWDAQTGAKLRERKSTTKGTTKLSFSLDGTRLARIGDTGVQVFDSASGACTFEVNPLGHYSSTPTLGRFSFSTRIEVLSVALSLDGTRIFGGLSDSNIRIWDSSVPRRPKTYEHDHYKTIKGVAFSPDCSRICTWGMDDHHIHVWDLSTGRILITLKGHSQSSKVQSVAFSLSSTHIVSGASDTAVRIWELVNTRQVKKLTIPPWTSESIHGPPSVAISPDGTRVACGIYPEGIYLPPYPWDSPGKVQSYPHTDSTAITFSPDGSRVYSVLDSSLVLDVVQWDTKSGKVISHGGSEPYNQAEPSEAPLLTVKECWVVSVGDHPEPFRKLFCIPDTYLPIQKFYTYRAFAVLVGPERFAILDFSDIFL